MTAADKGEVDWSGYEVYHRLNEWDYAELPRREARRWHEDLMSSKDARIDELRALLARNGVELSTREVHVHDLELWLFLHVTGHGGQPPGGQGLPRLPEQWHSFYTDLGLFYGDWTIAQHPDLHWGLYTHGSKKWEGYHNSTLLGWPNDPKGRACRNVLGITLSHGYRLSYGEEPSHGGLWKQLQTAEVQYNTWANPQPLPTS